MKFGSDSCHYVLDFCIPTLASRETKRFSTKSDAKLKEIYYDPKKAGSYGGITSLRKAVKADGNIHKLKYTDVQQ